MQFWRMKRLIPGKTAFDIRRRRLRGIAIQVAIYLARKEGGWKREDRTMRKSI